MGLWWHGADRHAVAGAEFVWLWAGDFRKANWAKAMLLWMVIFIGLSILLTVIGGVGLMSMS